MTLLPMGGLLPLVGAVGTGGTWLYDLLTKFGVDHGTARTVTDIIVRPVAVLLVVIVAIVAARLGSKALRRVLQRVADQTAARSGSARTGARMTTMSALVANVWRFFVFVVAVAIVLGMIGVNLTPLLASATIIGATIGFGAQQIIRDYLSGFLLTVEDQFGIGDSITVGTVTGVVEDLTLRVTRLRGADGTVYFVANGDIRLVSNTSRGWARAVVDLTLPGAAAAELEHVRTVVEGAAHQVATSAEFESHSSEPPTVVTFLDADATTMTLRVTLLTVPTQRDALTRELHQATVVALAEAGLWPGDAAAVPPASPPAPTS